MVVGLVKESSALENLKASVSIIGTFGTVAAVAFAAPFAANIASVFPAGYVEEFHGKELSVMSAAVFTTAVYGCMFGAIWASLVLARVFYFPRFKRWIDKRAE